jgi:DNA-binding IclR family transcriptional regulator
MAKRIADEPAEQAEQTGTGRRPEAVKSAQRTVELLELLAEAPRRLTHAELARELGVPKSSLHQLLQTLLASGWVEADERGTAYGIGLRALRVGAAYLDRNPVVQAGGAMLAHLQRQLDETVHLARLDGPEVVYLASRESQHHLRVMSRIGRRLPAHATALGKALLATYLDDEVDLLLPTKLSALTSNTVTDREALYTELAETRLRGWSFERGQNTPGLGCFGVAVPGQHPARYAVSCSVPFARLTEEHQHQIVMALIECADDLGHTAARLA